MLLRSFNLTSCFRRSACCFQTFKDLFGFFCRPIFDWGCKSRSLFYFHQNLFEFFFKFFGFDVSKNCRFFSSGRQRYGGDFYWQILFQIFLTFFCFTHTPLKELAFDYRCISKAGRKDKREHFPSKYFLKKVFRDTLKPFPVKRFKRIKKMLRILRSNALYHYNNMFASYCTQ